MTIYFVSYTNAGTTSLQGPFATLAAAQSAHDWLLTFATNVQIVSVAATVV